MAIPESQRLEDLERAYRVLGTLVRDEYAYGSLADIVDDYSHLVYPSPSEEEIEALRRLESS